MKIIRLLYCGLMDLDDLIAEVARINSIHGLNIVVEQTDGADPTVSGERSDLLGLLGNFSVPSSFHWIPDDDQQLSEMISTFSFTGHMPNCGLRLSWPLSQDDDPDKS